MARNQADLILFVLDANTEPNQEELEIAKILRKNSKKVILVANKSDNPQATQNTYNLAQLGFGLPIPVSAIHNFNFSELLQNIEKHLHQLGFKPSKDNLPIISDTIKIAFIGRPNAGKSSLINAILGESRLTVSDIPGTTRDSIDVELTYQNQAFKLIDTAGIRRRGRIEKGIEKYSIFRTIDAIEKADLVCLILDYSVGVRAQDLHISEYVQDNSKGLIIIVNKMDLMEEKETERNRITNLLRHRFDFLSWAPVIFTSAKNKKNIYVIFDVAQQIYTERRKEIDQETLKTALQEIIQAHKPPIKGRTVLRFYDIKQVGINPPTFELLVNDPDINHFSYQRYLENNFRERFGFSGTAIDFIYKPIDPKLARKSISL